MQPTEDFDNAADRDDLLAEVRAILRSKPTPAEVVEEIRDRVAAVPGRWHGCPQRHCRRRRRCGSTDLDCARVVLSPAQRAATLSRLNRALEQAR
jgi:hypothetical protein